MRETSKQIKSNPDRRSKMISAPSNFNHITHMGPGDGIQIQRLMDLPTTLETADQASHASHSPGLTSSQPVQRVKSMFGQSTGKLPPPRLPQHPPPPQRSISHSEAGMRQYLNGVGTPPTSGLSQHTGHRTGHRLMTSARTSSSSLPRSPDTDHSTPVPGLAPSSASGHGSLGSHSSHETVSYMNIYQNTNHQHIYSGSNIEGSPRHSLGSNNSSNLSTPPSPARDVGSSSYES